MKIIAVILIIGLISFGVFYINSRKSNSKILEDEIVELGSLVVESRDCGRVIEEAEAFLVKRKDAAEVWNFLGVCQFDIGKFEEAKVSFEKVLSLNPEHEGAKNYLALIKPEPGRTLISQTELNKLQLTRAEFESKIGVSLDDPALTFEKARLFLTDEAPQEVLESAFAVYSSSKSRAQTLEYLKNLFKQFNPTIGENGLSVKLSATKSMDVTLNFPSGQVIFNYTVKK